MALQSHRKKTKLRADSTMLHLQRTMLWEKQPCVMGKGGRVDPGL